MQDTIKITTPLTDGVLESLKAGDRVEITGVIYTARDAAHKRLVEALNAGDKLPVDLKGQIIYYTGPCPAKPGQALGPCGPTSSYRMDAYAPSLLGIGLKGMIGKGRRSKAVVDSMIENKAVYFAAVGGAAAVISRSVKKAEIVAYEDLGPEAIRRLEVENFPCIVATDSKGGDLYVTGPETYKR
jgi:fumarate hydratase subunit beta